jgi:GNAT superfamily N-acetyltransferase
MTIVSASLTVTPFTGVSAEWDSFVRQQRDWTHFHLLGWRAVIERTFGHECIYLAARDESGSLRGVLPLVRVRSVVFGHYLVSMPFVNYGGVLADDPEVARALLGAAEKWLRDRGRGRMVGPMDFTTNDECGLLVEGHERKPLVLQGWHHPYYLQLLEAYGLEKAMDLYMWELRLDKVEEQGGFHPMIQAAAKKVTGEHGVSIRNMRKHDFEAELRRFLEVYNAAWERNWGFVPLNENEVRRYAKDLKPILDERWTWLAERDGEVLGASLTLPDINVALAHMNGRLLPFGWAKFLWWRRKIDGCRVFALGVKPEYQDLGIAAAFYMEHVAEAKRPGGIWWGEMGWILETNEPMNRAMEGMGGKIVKRYRILEKAFDGGPGG